MTLSALASLALIQLLIAASPGPAAVLTIQTAAARGARAGIAVSIGLAAAILIWAGAAIAGLKVLFDIAPFLQTAFRIIGAAFLIYIGISMWRHAKTPIDTAKAAQGSLLRLVRLGFITDLANPKALAYFTAVFTGVLPAAPTMTDVILILTVVVAVEFIWYAALSLFFARPKIRQAYIALKSYLDRLFGAVIALLGIRIALP